MKEEIYNKLPNFTQNLLITIFDINQYFKRHAGHYFNYKIKYKESENYSKQRLKDEQEKRFVNFVSLVKKQSSFFNLRLINLKINSLQDLVLIPFLDKEEIRENIKNIVADKRNTFKSNTGGTTGKSLEVYFSWENAQERFACLDNFKERFGWKFGMKTAWFSGKNILGKRDLIRNRYWKTDFAYNIRYYSTFYINDNTAIYYIENFNKYQPLFFSGFPSSIVQIAKIGLRLGMKLNYKVKAIFPTAESLQKEDVKVMEKFYGAIVADQYSSSEGAPFITQCTEGHMHIEPISGIFEVFDEEGNPSDKGELVVTSFTTEKTPLLRYRIGDFIELDSEIRCKVHSGQVVKRIHGRINDYIFSKETGKINLGNISNSVKYTPDIIKFQIIQDAIEEIIVKIVVDERYDNKQENIFLKELRARFGDKMDIQLKYVEDIPKESSGKYRIIKNNIKDKIELHISEA